MGWTGGSEILSAVWPDIERYVDAPLERGLIYADLVAALEMEDADTLDEVVYCTTEQVDPVLVAVLIERGHLDPPELEED